MVLKTTCSALLIICLIFHLLLLAHCYLLPLLAPRRTRGRRLLLPVSSRRFVANSKDDDDAAVSRSLAGPYLIHTATNSTSWTLIPLADVGGIDETTFPSPGARAWAALHQDAEPSSSPQHLSSSIVVLTVEYFNEKLVLTSIPAPSSWNSDLIAVLLRILVQNVLQKAPSKTASIQFAGEGEPIFLIAADLSQLQSYSTTNWNDDDENENNVVRKLFVGIDDGSEIVEMVNQNGEALGFVPRKLVHRFNILHRGIGMFVTKDRHISASAPHPDLYCHRRTDTKRIFPSLYDMFVGGVSLAGEDSELTARREVAEELGLSSALTNDNGTQKLSGRLLTCVVCTAYNRCVVDLFSYTMDTERETVKWQEEEVAWGAFVPYEVVRAAADRSIMRLAAVNEWPGRHPPIQSRRQRTTYNAIDPTFEDSASWDFVPDGLLVWEAWLHFLKDCDTTNESSSSLSPNKQSAAS